MSVNYSRITSGRVCLAFGALWGLLTLLTGARIGLFGDDAAHLLHALKPADGWELVRGRGWPHHPPGHFLLLRLWANLSLSEAWLRSLNLLLTFASALVLFFLGRRMRNGQVGAWAVILFLLCGRTALNALEIRSYALAILCIASFLYFLVRWLESDRPAFLMASALFAGGAHFSHYGSVLVVLPGVLFGMSELFSSRQVSVRRVLILLGAQLGWVLPLGLFLHGKRPDLGVVERAYLSDVVYHSGSGVDRFQFAAKMAIESLGGLVTEFPLPTIASILLLLFVLKGLPTPKHSMSDPGVVSKAVLFVLPLCLVGVLSAATLYPGGATRHVSFLLVPFSLACALAVEPLFQKVATFMGSVVGPTAWRCLGWVALLGIVPLYLLGAILVPISRYSSPAEAVYGGVLRMMKSADPATLFVADTESTQLLRFYLLKLNRQNPSSKGQPARATFITHRTWRFSKAHFCSPDGLPLEGALEGYAEDKPQVWFLQFGGREIKNDGYPVLAKYDRRTGRSEVAPGLCDAELRLSRSFRGLRVIHWRG